MISDKKIVFMGTPEIAASILRCLIESGYNVIGVVCQEDKPVGRKKIITPPPAKMAALSYNIPVFQPHKIRDDYSFLKNLQPDLVISCAYGQFIPQGALDIAPLGNINIHGSLLPKYRGASPIQQALIHGDAISGVTIMEMIDRMDAGNMYLKKEVAIDENDNYSSLYKKITEAGKEAILELLPSFLENKPSGEVQNEAEVIKCGKITKENEHLLLSYSCSEFINWVRGLSDIPGGYLLLDDQVFKILKAHKVNDKVSVSVGKIVQADKNGLVLQLKDGQVNLDLVQKQGKNVMDFRSFINGNKNLEGKEMK